MNRLLLAMLYWPGDQAMAEETLRLITDLQEGHSEDAGVAFVARFDAIINRSVVDYVARKFDVFTHVTRRREVGFPAGCNAMAFDLFFWLSELRATGKLDQYGAVLILEPDCLPLTPDWLLRVRQEWAACRPAVQMGHVFRFNGEDPWSLHCNASSVFALEPQLFQLFLREGGCDPTAGWDWRMYAKLAPLGVADTPVIRFAHPWRPTNQPTEWFQGWVAGGCRLLHGVKDYTGHVFTRSTCLPLVKTG